MQKLWTTPPSGATVVGLALVVPMTAAWLMSLARTSIVSTNAALVLVIVVVAVAASGHRGAGVVAALSSTVCFDYFLTQPYHTLTISDGDDVETAVLLVVVGLAVTELALWGRRQQARASRRVGYLAGVVAAARSMSQQGSDTSELVDVVGRHIRDVLGVESCRYEPGPSPTSTVTLTPEGDLTRGGQQLDVDRNGLPTEDAVELPVTHRGEVFGRYVVVSATRVSRPDAEQRRVAVTLAQQLGAALAEPPQRADSHGPAGTGLTR